MPSDFILPNQAKLAWLRSIVFGVNVLADLQLALYKMDQNVGRYTTLAELISWECDYDGYGRFSPIDWSDPVIQFSNLAATQPTTPTFQTFSSSGLIYGAFGVNIAGDELYFAGKFESPIELIGSQTLFLELSLFLASMVNN